MSELVVYEQLTLVEIDRLTELEAIVEQGLQTFVEVGLALLAIRDERLYRQTHGTFVDYLAERWQMSESQGYRLIDAGRVAELISPIGEIANEAQARELVPLLDDEAELLDTWRELRAEHGDKLTAEKVRAAVDDRLRRDQVLSYMGSSASDEWNTPQEFFDVLDAEFRFDLDVCCLPTSAKCARFFTPADDALAQVWEGRCWMNPPYGRTIGDWMQKAYESAQTTAELVVCLIPARVDAGWFWDYCSRGEIRLIRGRLQFENADSGAPFPSAVVIFQRGRMPDVCFWRGWPVAA